VCLVLGLLVAAGALSAQGTTAWAVAELKAMQERLPKLAGAVPADKFTWRPGEGVRSIAEVYLHVAAANFNLPRLIGVQPPAGLDLRGLEKSTTDKDKVIELLRQSYDHAIAAVSKLSEADLDKPLERPSFVRTYRDTVMVLATHSHEHLGQSIAYARVNGIVPPWTEEQQQRAKQAPAKK
jgi:uncharacterized damage-inducible protein DinB